MAAARPGAAPAPHVKAHKCSALARQQAALGHRGFCCATLREMEGWRRGSATTCCSPTRCSTRAGSARSTRASRSRSTRRDARSRRARRRAEVLVEVNVGLPRCGCARRRPALADAARRAASGCGVMGYEVSDAVRESGKRAGAVEQAMQRLLRAHGRGRRRRVAVGTCTYALNRWPARFSRLVRADGLGLHLRGSAVPPGAWVEATVIRFAGLGGGRRRLKSLRWPRQPAIAARGAVLLDEH